MKYVSKRNKYLNIEGKSQKATMNLKTHTHKNGRGETLTEFRNYNIRNGK